MDHSKMVRKPLSELGFVGHDRPSREGGKNRVGVPFAIGSPTKSQIEARKQSDPNAQAEPPSGEPRRRVWEPPVFLLQFIAYLREERKRRGLSLADVSRVSGLDRGMICHLENGQIPNPTFNTLWTYATALGEQPSALFLNACRSAAEAETKPVSAPQ